VGHKKRATYVQACHLHGRLTSLQLNWHHGIWLLPSENLEKVKPSRPEGPWRLVLFWKLDCSDIVREWSESIEATGRRRVVPTAVNLPT